VTGTQAVPRGRPPAGASPQAAPPTAGQAFALRCLAPGDAAELIRPLVADRAARIVVSPVRAPHVLTVRAPSDAAQVAWQRARLVHMISRGESAPLRGVSSGPARDGRLREPVARDLR
jgi:hypothetical protein